MTMPSGEENWKIGDRALAEVPVGLNGVKTGVWARLEKIAAEEGLPFRAIRHYRAVSYDWPPETRRSDLAWGVHVLLRHEDDRFDLIWAENWKSGQAKEYVRSRPPRRPTQLCRLCEDKHFALGLCRRCWRRLYMRERRKAKKEAGPKAGS